MSVLCHAVHMRLMDDILSKGSLQNTEHKIINAIFKETS
jgi:hypothetical protein